MPEYTITVTDEEDKVLKTELPDPQGWAQHALKNKARKITDRIIEANTDRQPKKVPVEEKASLIRDMTLETRVARDARELAEAQKRFDAN